jgi:hypothetical protein
MSWCVGEGGRGAVVKLSKMRAAATSGSSSQAGDKGLGNETEPRKCFAHLGEVKAETVSNTSCRSRFFPRYVTETLN